MKIAVIGAGAIGSLVAGYLKLKNLDVVLIGHGPVVPVIKENGLKISGVRGDFKVNIEIADRLDFKPDIVILATKTQDLESAIKDNLIFIKDATILTTQNGVSADSIVAKYIPEEQIISSIVMFGSTSLKTGEVVHNFENPWIIGSLFPVSQERVAKVKALAEQIFPAPVVDDIQGMKYLKVFVNSNNCITGILGVSMQEAFADLGVSAISIAIWKEGLKVIEKAGIKLISLPDFPLERLVKLTSLPTTQAAGIFSGIMINLSKEPLYGSILQSIKRGKSSEIDYINGEFVKIASENNFHAPLNELLVKLVHDVELSGKFLKKEDLLKATEGLI